MLIIILWSSCSCKLVLIVGKPISQCTKHKRTGNITSSIDAKWSIIVYSAIPDPEFLLLVGIVALKRKFHRLLPSSGSTIHEGAFLFKFSLPVNDGDNMA